MGVQGATALRTTSANVGRFRGRRSAPERPTYESGPPLATEDNWLITPGLRLRELHYDAEGIRAAVQRRSRGTSLTRAHRCFALFNSRWCAQGQSRWCFLHRIDWSSRRHRGSQVTEKIIRDKLASPEVAADQAVISIFRLQFCRGPYIPITRLTRAEALTVAKSGVSVELASQSLEVGYNLPALGLWQMGERRHPTFQ